MRHSTHASVRRRTGLRPQARARPTYREESSSDETAASDDEARSQPRKRVQLSRSRSRRTNPPSPNWNAQTELIIRRATRGPNRTMQRVRPNVPTSKPKAAPGMNRTIRTRSPQATAAAHPIASDNHIPPWSTLPYEILFSVFRLASHPLCENGAPTSSVKWLLMAAMVCKQFAEPALAALYEVPPLTDNAKPHELGDLLNRSPSYSNSINYATKIKHLDLEVIRTLAYSTPGRGHADFHHLLGRMSQLSGLCIRTLEERPPYRAYRVAKWFYPMELFEALKEARIKLRTWRWNAKLLTRSATDITYLHASETFRSLQNLSLSYFDLRQAPWKTSASGNPDDLCTSLASLDQLQSLALENCSIDDWDVLAKLPPLSSLTIANCDRIDSKSLEAFLSGHGQNLHRLQLDHNRALDLKFFLNLRTICPRLVHIKADLMLFSSLALSSHDTEPEYSVLLNDYDFPQWPTTLQSIELLHLRKWSTASAKSFFESLVAAAPDMPHLRTLIVRATLNDLGWRERSKFRDTWIGLLERTFKSVSPPPRSDLASFRTYRERHTPRVVVPIHEPVVGSVQEMEDESATKHASSRRSGRVKALEDQVKEQKLQDEMHTSEDEGIEYGDSRGTCEVVDIGIDNLRPTEVQFNEGDFLDSEASGDEDWNGDDVFTSPPQYAW